MTRVDWSLQLRIHQSCYLSQHGRECGWGVGVGGWGECYLKTTNQCLVMSLFCPEFPITEARNPPIFFLCKGLGMKRSQSYPNQYPIMAGIYLQLCSEVPILCFLKLSSQSTNHIFPVSRRDWIGGRRGRGERSYNQYPITAEIRLAGALGFQSPIHAQIILPILQSSLTTL